METILDNKEIKLQNLINKLVEKHGYFLEDKILFAKFITNFGDLKNTLSVDNIPYFKNRLEHDLVCFNYCDQYDYEYNFLMDLDARKKLLNITDELCYLLHDKLLGDFSKLCGIEFSNWNDAYQEAKKLI
jgi:hypothetical protein